MNHPSGTVTFLFTDIEGSTKLAHEYPDQWEALRARHHSILQSAMDTNNGFVFQIIGDAFCVAFHAASDALNAAIDAQRKLQMEDWDTTPIKVRMGIHTGEAQVHGDEYHGYLTMSLVQRIMSAGHGGQILLSGAAENLLRGGLSKDTGLRDMGEHKLKNVAYAVRVYQVIAPELTIDFPALRALDVFPNNLPTQLTSFVGREKELADAKRLLQNAHLLTLIGPGGTGKTRLSIQSANESLTYYSDGVWLVELAPILDALLVPRTTALAIGLRDEPQRPVIDMLCEFLRDKKMLIILDNCEHLVDACAQMANKILQAAPHVRVLASSREALGIAGEVTYRVPSLRLPDMNHLPSADSLSQYEAVKLFIDRATSSVPTFSVTNDNAPALAQICHRLDGIPLAIELAAAKVRVLSVEQIAKRLDDRFRLLTGGSRAALERHQTLRATIDWGHNLLSPLEQILFRRLSVFVGGWTLEAAESVCGFGGINSFEVLDVLTHLVDKSLAIVDEGAGTSRYPAGGSFRYRMLETIRQYASEKLFDANEGDKVHERHLRFFLDMTNESKQELEKGNQTVLENFESERGNLRAAIEWSQSGESADAGLELAAALLWYWALRGYLSEGIERLRSSLALSQTQARSQVRAKALNALGNLLSRQANFSEAKRILDEALVAGLALDDKWNIAKSYDSLGYIAAYQGNFDEANSYNGQSLEISRELGDNLGIIDSLEIIAETTLIRGDYPQALTIFEEELELARNVNHINNISYVVRRLGQIKLFQGELRPAINLFQESLSLNWQVGDKQAVAACLAAFGSVAMIRADMHRAAQLFGASEALSESIYSTLLPYDHDQYTRTVVALHNQLDKATFNSAWAAGRAMSMEQAIAFALEETHD